MGSQPIFSNKDKKAQELKFAFEKEVARFLENLPYLSRLNSAISYVLQSGGKRNRPILMLSILQDLKIGVNSYLPVALAIELIHIASLVHDDLPALDNDKLRRGKNTCHVEFNEATAILTGDILFPAALNHIERSGLEPVLQLKVIQILNKAFMNLCYGQQMDLDSKESDIDNILLAQLKTGALFAAVFEVAAVLARLDSKIVDFFKEAGLHVGICYQICDDYADQSDFFALKGRVESSDKRNLKKTFYIKDDMENLQSLINRSIERFNFILDTAANQLKPTGDFSHTRDVLNKLFSPFKGMQIKF